ncbi:MAG: universal stress protein [Deltaproteobacteria bacterium]|nr:universal stress protein [Deltaproteobacteria bacterium]
MKRILVGIDGSEQGWAALHRAGELAKATGSALEIAHVIRPITPALGVGDLTSAAVTWMMEEEDYSRQLLREAVARVKEFGVEVNTRSLVGSAAEELAELARPDEVTMAVVGHRGRNLAARLFLGSVADRLAQICSKAVLIVR